jgi:hypothetical protein
LIVYHKIKIAKVQYKYKPTPFPDFSERRLCVTGRVNDKIKAGAQHGMPLLSDFET